jgi:DNA recombination protein RmuC
VPTTLLATLATTAVTAALVWLWARSRQIALREQLRAGEKEAIRLNGELAIARSAFAEAQDKNTQIEKELSAERAGTAAKLAAEQQRFVEQEHRAAQYLADIEKMRGTLQTQFEVIAAKLLDEKSAKFADQNKDQIDTILHPLRQQLADFRSRIDIVYKTESDDRASLKAQIEQLRLLNSRVTDEAHALTHALKGQAQARGAWGELVLERLLEGSGLRRGEDYVAQESIVGADGRSRVRPDIILRLPGQRHLVIDSKVSLVDYEQAVNAPESAAREIARKAHAAAVRKHVQELADKSYDDAGQLFTPWYVFMFIPIEPAFAMALETDPALYEWAFDRNVILVTSSGLLVALRTVATIWKQDRQTKNVQEIARRGGLLYDKFAGLYTDLEELGKNLGRARESYDEVLSKLKTGRGNLLFQVEELKTLGAKAQKSLPPGDSVDT